MRTGRLSISRGHQIEGVAEASAPRLKLVQSPAEPAPAQVSAPAEAPPVSPDYHLVHDRLTVLERLTRLRKSGALSAEEFAAEKARILALPADELLLNEPAPVHFVPATPRGGPQQGPSLLGRLLQRRFILFIMFSLGAGLAFSYAAQPNATLRFIDQSLRIVGA